MTADGGPACCACGAVLADAIDGETVVVGGRRRPFRRGTDFLACEACGAIHRAEDVRARLRAGGGARAALRALHQQGAQDPDPA